LLKEQAAKGAVLRAMTCIKFDPTVEKYYRSAIGDVAVDAIKQLDDITLEKIGIRLVAQPNTAQAKATMEILATAMQPGQDGHPTLGPDEYFFVSMCVYEGRIKEAQSYLSYTMNKKKQDLEAKAAAAQEAQNKAMQDLETQKADAELKKLQAEAQIEKDKITHQEEEKRKTLILVEKEKRKSIRLEKQLEPKEVNSNNP
jgi:hypothetical protein